MKALGTRAFAVLAVLGSFLVVGVVGATAGFHGAAVAKSTSGPVKVGDPYVSSALFSNTVDEDLDILRVTGLSDTVAAASGNVTQSLTGTGLIFTNQVFAFLPAGTISCDGTGAGTAGDPRINWTECFLDFNTRITTVPFSFYTVQPGDFNLPNNQLTNTITWNWNNTCQPGTTQCSTGPQTATAAAAAMVLKRDSATATDIHDGAHAVVTTVAVGTTVHDLVTVTGDPGQAVPTGNVNVDWFLNGDCTGAPAANSGSIGPLNAAGQFDATGFAFTVNTAGMRAFRGHYEGDGTYNPSDGPCEPLQVVDANIQINPPTATNRVGTNHTLTCHINVNDGTGFVNATDGTICTVSIISGPGSPASQNCSVSGGGGDCDVIITSAATGTSVIRASTDVTVAGLALHRETGDAHPGDGPNAEKLWVNAAIVIAPNATNEVGQPHTFTATVLQDSGSGLTPVGAGLPCNITLTNGNGAVANPAGPFNLTTNAAGQCSATFTSQTGGTVTGHASSTVTINGVVMNVETDGIAPNSGDAVKTFVDANIQLNPPTAANAINTNHPMTCHININAGDGAGYVNAPAGTTCTGSIQSGPGSFVGPNSCNTVGATGDCTLTITSSTTGQTVIRATTNVTVGGVTMTRTTGDAHPGDSADATKNWVNAAIVIAPNATNEVGQPHTFTATVLLDTGSGLTPVGAGEQCVITLTNQNGAVANPAGPFNLTTNASGQCSATFTSATPGQVIGNASSTLTVNGVSFNVSTNGVAPNSGPATKTFVDANIQLTPATANNAVGTNHTLSCHINVNEGQGAGFVNAPAGTICTGSIQSGPGSFVGPNSCATLGATGSCPLVITSATTGTTVVRATTTLSVGGVSLTRTTGDSHVGDSADANKNWADDTVRTDIHNAAHGVITSANVGDVVHDKAFVEKAAGTPASVPDPTGNVIFHRFDTIDCSGPAASNETVALSGGTAESSTFTVAGPMSYQAEYLGDANYPAHTGACEPLQVNTTPPCPAGSFTFNMNASGDLVIVYDQFPAPNDNSYGINSVGWGKKTHTFGNLTGSDHAGFQLKDGSGTVRLSFNIDYLTSKTGTPSGYASLGPFGGDGKVLTGSLTPADIMFDTSLARNLNNTGYFAGGAQVVGNAVANLLVDSPPTMNTTDSYVLTPAAAAVFTAPNPDSADSPGWNFHNTYFVTIKAAKLAAMGFNPATWLVEPNDDQLHNSPAKPCPCPVGVDPNPTLDVLDNGNGTTTITYTQSLAVNDNSYGTGTDPSWGDKSHTFGNLTGSDKAQFVLTNGNGQVVNDFTLDYISQKSGTPSGYGTLCASGGDGKLDAGPAPLSCTTSLADNLNTIPCPSFTTNSPVSPGPDPACPAWEFRSIYKVTVSNSIFGASGFGSADVPSLHNSPSKPQTCPAGGGGGGSQCNFTILKKEVKDKKIEIEIKNNGTVDEFISAVHITWPAAINGKLKKVKLGGDVLYDNPDIAGGTADLTLAQLTSDDKKRKLKKGEKQTLTFEFENKASTTLANYTGSLEWGPNCVLMVLP